MALTTALVAAETMPGAAARAEMRNHLCPLCSGLPEFTEACPLCGTNGWGNIAGDARAMAVVAEMATRVNVVASLGAWPVLQGGCLYAPGGGGLRKSEDANYPCPPPPLPPP